MTFANLHRILAYASSSAAPPAGGVAATAAAAGKWGLYSLLFAALALFAGLCLAAVFFWLLALGRHGGTAANGAKRKTGLWQNLAGIAIGPLAAGLTILMEDIPGGQMVGATDNTLLVLLLFAFQMVLAAQLFIRQRRLEPRG